MTEDYGNEVQSLTPVEAKQKELEETFSYDGYQVVRKELFAHLRDPAVTVRDGNITFNTACIGGLEDVVYVQLMFNEDLKRLVVKGCREDDKDALRWCVAKPDKRKSRKMSCKKFTDLVYGVMKWSPECRYKILGYRIDFEGETIYVFDFTVPEIFIEKKKGEQSENQSETEATNTTDNTPEITGVENPPADTRKGFYADDIAGTFGVPIEEHRQSTEVHEMDGFVSMGMLTGR